MNTNLENILTYSKVDNKLILVTKHISHAFSVYFLLVLSSNINFLIKNYFPTTIHNINNVLLNMHKALVVFRLDF